MIPTLGGTKEVLITTWLVREFMIETALALAPKVAPNAQIHIQLLGYVMIATSTTCEKTCQTAVMSNAVASAKETKTNTAPLTVPYQHPNGFTT